MCRFYDSFFPKKFIDSFYQWYQSSELNTVVILFFLLICIHRSTENESLLEERRKVIFTLKSESEALEKECKLYKSKLNDIKNQCISSQENVRLISEAFKDIKEKLKYFEKTTLTSMKNIVRDGVETKITILYEENAALKNEIYTVGLYFLVIIIIIYLFLH